ncbi:MAG TPA: formate dehydrogenase accessory protein FdhE [Vicinamibacterales bacterium]|nr:formate dehydrogenase accessory protein FdhE [Vicinamibacterales bacterium]
MTERPIRPPRADPRDIAELKHLKTSQPELAAGVDMQLALVEMQRRVQGRVPLPWIQIDADWAAAQQRAARPLVRFRDIPLEWSDFRLTFRQTADILQRFDALDRPDYDAIVAMGREGNTLEPVVTRWYDVSSGVDGPDTGARVPAGAPVSLEHVLVLALRPFLARCAEALSQRVDLSSWTHGHCPYCGWEADFAVIMPSADRRLICGRCTGQWAFAPFTCPFCANDDRARVTSFATRDGRYRVYACDVCRRYLKAYDGRNATRPVMVAVDSIATLPLDAAAIQRGYVG